jgi:hypothetical protein
LDGGLSCTIHSGVDDLKKISLCGLNLKLGFLIVCYYCGHMFVSTRANVITAIANASAMAFLKLSEESDL